VKKLSLLVLLLLLIAGAGAGAGYWFLVLEADEDELEQENRAPQATITVTPVDGQVLVNETVSFRGHQSSDPDGDSLTYVWEFGDSNSSSGISVSHAYDAEGAYTVRLTVTDPAGLNDFAETVITVAEPQVETFEGEGTVSCQLTGNCDTEDVPFEVKQGAALASMAWDLTQNGVITTAEVTITIYNSTDDAVYNETGQGQGEYSTEFSGADLESLGEWKWEIEAEQGSMDWNVTIRIEY
jgi:PKD repeat protein|tara:strand:+ start:315 stop:1034 length:720 start_codon:yes stop_codon:yes gene_type:complete